MKVCLFVCLLANTDQAVGTRLAPTRLGIGFRPLKKQGRPLPKKKFRVKKRFQGSRPTHLAPAGGQP